MACSTRFATTPSCERIHAVRTVLMQRREAAALAALGALGAIVAAATYRTGASLGEDSTRFALASALLDGRVPYRTLLSGRPPGSYIGDALVMAVKGRSMGSQHLAAAIESRVLYPVLIYVIGRRIVAAPAAFAAACGVLASSAPVPGIALGCALASLALGVTWIGSGSPAALAASGVAAAFELAFSAPAAVTAAAAVCLTVVARAAVVRGGGWRVPLPRQLATFGAGWAAGCLPLTALLALDGGLPEFARSLAASPPGARPAAGASLALAIVCLPVLMTMLVRASVQPAARGWAPAGLLFASSTLLRVATGAGSGTAFADAPLLAALVVARAVAQRGRIAIPRADLVLGAAAGLAASATWRITGSGAAGGGAVVVAVLATAVVRLQAPTGRAPPRVVRATAALCLAAVLPSAFLVPRPGRSRRTAVLSGARWPSGLAVQIGRAAAAVRSADPGAATVLVVPEGGFLYDAIGLRNPTDHPVIERGHVPSETADVVLVRYADAGGHARLLRRIEDAYTEVRRLDAPELWGIFTPRTSGPVCRHLTLYADESGTEYGRTAGRGEPSIVQRTVSARIPVRGGSGASVRFAIARASVEPGRERSIDAVADGRTTQVWRGAPDGLLHTVALPPGSSAVVLRSPAGRTTLWIDPISCTQGGG